MFGAIKLHGVEVLKNINDCSIYSISTIAILLLNDTKQTMDLAISSLNFVFTSAGPIYYVAKSIPTT